MDESTLLGGVTILIKRLFLVFLAALLAAQAAYSAEASRCGLTVMLIPMRPLHAS